MKRGLDFTGKCTMITGASGEIGKVMAETFAQYGSDLFLVDMVEKEEELVNLRDRISELYKKEVSTYCVDIRDTQSIKKMEQDFLVDKKTIDILVNNAGINVLVPAHMLEENQWDNVVDTNLKGTFFMSQIVGRTMIRRGQGGVIINIASQHGEVGNVDRAPYCASKAGIINLSRALSIEWAKHNIRVNCVSPTFVIHEKNKNMLNHPSTMKKYISNIPLGRYCVPEDVADATVFLASSMASMITGQNLVVDGGYIAR